MSNNIHCHQDNVYAHVCMVKSCVSMWSVPNFGSKIIPNNQIPNLLILNNQIPNLVIPNNQILNLIKKKKNK